MSDVGGFVAAGYERVAEVMANGATYLIAERERRADLGRGGGAFAAYVGDECVVDLWSGASASGVPWARDTRAVIMSATKGLTSLCAHVLFDRGDLDLNAPVVTYWPEFGAAGKEDTQIRHVLSHQSGAIGVPDADHILSWDGEGWSDTQAIAAVIAAAAPAWEPGTKHGYHGVTYGWLVAELVRRISGQSLGAFFASEVASPLDVDCQIGTPASDLATLATVMEWSPPPTSRRSTLTTIDPATWAGRSVLAGPKGHLFADEHGTPRFADFMNSPRVLAAEIGAINATGSARGLARVYSALAVGEELVSRQSVLEFSAEQVCGRDAVMKVPTRWAVGYTREPPALIPGLPRQHGPDDAAFGHMGAGGQIGFADPIAGVGCGFVRNHLENQAMPLMGASLVAALYECLGSNG